MKISIMQMYNAMNTTPEFVEIKSLAGAGVERKLKSKANRSLCLQLIKEGERCIKTLMTMIKVTKVTILIILKEFNDAGLIEFFSSIGKQSKIVNVL